MSEGIRKEVRSHVTARQHRLNRERKRQEASTEEERQTSSSRTRSNPATFNEEEEEKTVILEVCFDNEEHSSDISIGPQDMKRNFEEKTTAAQLQDRPLQPPGTLLSVETILRSAPLARRTSRMALLHDPADSIASMLGRLRLNFPVVMVCIRWMQIASMAKSFQEHYHWIVATQARDFEMHFMRDLEPGSGAETLIPGISKDPALIATAVLIAAGHMLAIRNAPMSQNISRCIYELRNFVIAHLNSAIQDPERAISDPLLVAVLILATHEGFQGSVDNYHIHMRGLIQMINMRGGLHKLDESQPYIKKLIIWQDTNVATIMKCKPYYFSAKNSAEAPTVTPNPRLWLLMDAVPP